MAEIRHLKNRHDVIFFCRRWFDLDKISETGAGWHVDCGDMVEIETRCRITIWWIQWHVTCHIAGCCHLANSMSWFQSYVSHCRGLPSGELYGMSSQSHVSHCRMLPLGEFTVTIPEPRGTLQGAVTWWNQCHDRATLQGVRIPSAMLKILFRHILFYFIVLMQFRLWREAAFISSPIHLSIADKPVTPINNCIREHWMAAYHCYTQRMKTLFRGWPVMVHDTHTRRRS